jgi:protein-serine/threonine kinase
MQQLLCEPEDRLGSQAAASVSRPNSLLVQSRRSGFVPPLGQTQSVDGAYIIKVCLGTRIQKQLD